MVSVYIELSVQLREPQTKPLAMSGSGSRDLWVKRVRVLDLHVETLRSKVQLEARGFSH